MAKSIGYRCVICRRWRGKPLTKIMADLPAFRIEPNSPPFKNTSIDYFGPILIKYGRRQRTKGYGVIFTCLVTRGIYLDITSNLTTENFLMTFRRFIALYGQPQFIRSDNGKNFRGAAVEIKNMLRKWMSDSKDRTELEQFASKYSLKWTFSTPLASQHNGAELVVIPLRNIEISYKCT